MIDRRGEAGGDSQSEPAAEITIGGLTTTANMPSSMGIKESDVDRLMRNAAANSAPGDIGHLR
jgi:hypothetical protein